MHISGYIRRRRFINTKFSPCQEVGATSETYQLQFSDKKKFQEYIDSCFERSVLKRDIEVTSDDKIVTLSTCTGNSETRFLVQGKLIETYKAV